MDTPLPYKRLVHADWSTSPRKRWAATAVRTDAGWLAQAATPVGDTKVFLDNLLTGSQPTLAGLDFPIGVPEFYGQATRFGGFCEALAEVGSGPWSSFYDVAEVADQISLHRPFYPMRASSMVRQSHLIDALGASSIDQLRRRCERATASRRAACPLFWTLGGNQVGKAAISGWREVVSPARRRGAKLWPFEGSLATLAQANALTLAETYPAEAYKHVGVHFAVSESKRRQQDRMKAASGICIWSASRGVAFTPKLTTLLDNGFGPKSDGEDAFDAVMGLLGMIEVADGHRPEGSPQEGSWEGWILGQSN